MLIAFITILCIAFAPVVVTLWLDAASAALEMWDDVRNQWRKRRNES